MNEERARRALWRLMRAAEADAQRLAAEAAEALRGFDEQTVRRLVRESIESLTVRITVVFQRRIEQAIRLGARAGFAALGEGDAAAAEWLRRHREEIVARFSPRVVLDAEPVLRRGLAEVESALVAGRSAQQAAYALRDEAGYEPGVTISRRVTEAAEAARRAVLAAGPVAQRRFGRAVARLESYARRLGRLTERAEGYSVRGTTLETAARLREAVDRMRPGLIDEAVKWHVYHKQTYHARLTARTEMSRAYNETFVESAEALGATKVKWYLNKTRHVPDVCDEMAMGHSPGCPPGVYLIGDRPELPAHPSCMCYWEHVIE